jgi:hypothetical protein
VLSSDICLDKLGKEIVSPVNNEGPDESSGGVVPVGDEITEAGPPVVTEIASVEDPSSRPERTCEVLASDETTDVSGDCELDVTVKEGCCEVR